MTRPAPALLDEYTDRKYKTTQVQKADGIYVILYNGIPINLRTLNSLTNDPAIYTRCMFANKGHAKILARKLNALFKTESYQVKEMIEGIIIKL